MQTIGGYEVVKLIGQGGMGSVLHARTGDGRRVAIKVLHRTSGEAVARFERERRLLASLGEGDGFVPLLDSGTCDLGPFLVMPLIEGGTLRAKLDAGPLSVVEAFEVASALARAMGLAHARGVVHRDLKPENILFDRGRPLIADLGLAKHFDRGTPGASQSVSLSSGGEIRGTAGYMSPEQLHDAKSAGPAADVFALGAILYECLAGHPAFEAPNVVALLEAVEAGRVEPVRREGVPGGVTALIARALATDPKRRPEDAAAFARELSRARSSSRSAARPLLVGVVAGGLVLGAAWLLLGSSSRSAPPPAPGPSPPAPPPPRLTKPALDLVKRAYACSEKGDVRGAIEEDTRATQLDPRCEDAWVHLGSCHSRLEEWDAAIAASGEAIKLAPRDPRPYTTRGWAHLGKGEFDAAIEDATRAVEIDSKQRDAWATRAQAKIPKADFRGAIADATRTLEVDPEWTVILVARGSAHEALHEWPEAIADYERYLKTAPKNEQTVPMIRDRLKFLRETKR